MYRNDESEDQFLTSKNVEQMSYIFRPTKYSMSGTRVFSKDGVMYSFTYAFVCL